MPFFFVMSPPWFRWIFSKLGRVFFGLLNKETLIARWPRRLFLEREKRGIRKSRECVVAGSPLNLSVPWLLTLRSDVSLSLLTILSPPRGWYICAISMCRGRTVLHVGPHMIISQSGRTIISPPISEGANKIVCAAPMSWLVWISASGSSVRLFLHPKKISVSRWVSDDDETKHCECWHELASSARLVKFWIMLPQQSFLSSVKSFSCAS